MLKRLLILVLLFIFCAPSVAFALSPEQRRVLDSGAYYVDVAGSTAQGVCGTLLAGSNNEERTWNYLIGKGLSVVQASGAMGNMRHEGNFNPKIVERGHMEGTRWVNRAPYQFPPEMDTVPPHNLAPIASGRYAGQPGYGIVQWTSPGRKQGLIDFASTRNLPVHDLGLQLDYMWSELEGPYRQAALDPLMQATDLAEAVSIWQDHYEVGSNFDPRYQAAQEYLARYGSGTDGQSNTGATPTVSCGAVALDPNGCPQEPVDQSQIVDAEGIRVHPCIAAEVSRIVQLARAQGLDLGGGGWRDIETQISLREAHGCGGSRLYDRNCRGSPPTAVPGRSRHERGTAVDFNCNGRAIPSRSHECFIFLQENTSLQNLPSEPWHWSIDGH